MIIRAWEGMKRLLEYHERSAAWWGQAIWFYNRLNGERVPQDIFQVVERSGAAEAVPSEYVTYTIEVLEFWRARPGLAETLLPER